MFNQVSFVYILFPFIYFQYVFFCLQSVIMLMFREEKSPEDEIKAWQFWHSRQHSVKQRILDAGKKYSHQYFLIFTKIFFRKFS